MRFVSKLHLPVVLIVTLVTLGLSLSLVQAQDETITFWSVTNGEGWLNAYQHACDAYQETHPGFNCEIQITTNGFEELKANLTAGTGPDIFHLSGTRLATAPYVSAGYLEPLTDLGYIQNAPKIVTESWTFDDQIYGAAIDNYTGGLYYNTTIFETAGLEAPTSFPELLAVCDALVAQGITPIAPMFADSWTTGLVATFIAGTTVMADEPDWFSKRVNGETTFAESAGWQAVVDQLDELNQHKCFGDLPTASAYADSQNLFVAGDAAMWLQGTWAAGAIVGSGVDPAIVRLIPYPASENPGESYTAVAIGNAFSVNANSAHVDTAKDFLQFIYSDEDLVREFAAYNGGFTLYMPSASSAEQQPIFESFVNDVYGERVAGWAADYMIGGTQVTLSDLLQGMLAGQLAPEDVLPQLDDAWNTYQTEHPEVVEALGS